MNSSSARFDVAIIGSGIAGSTLGAILARQGLRVILFEGSSHPRFAIGESMILETSEVMRSLADLYDVPELAYFSSENYLEQVGTSHGIKRHFSYLHHIEGQPFNRQHTLQAVIPKMPHGHELHLYRQDTDYFLMTTAIRHGAKVLQKTRIESIQIDATGVELTSAIGEHFQAEYVVDAGGFRSLLSEKFNLRHRELQTHSRAIFTHMIEVPCYHDVSDPKDTYRLPFQLSEGTLHHVFEGGWLWVIPFDNHVHASNPLCSVGLMLDPRRHPMQPDLNPEEEFYQFIQRFPGIAAQFQQAKAVRDWTRTGRIQYSSKKVVGDRFCLLGQAAGFIDPLFSKGLYMALSCTSLLADRLITAKATGDYSTHHFQSVEAQTLAYIRANDQLVANAYQSFSNYQLWAPFSVLWLLGAYLELVKLTSSRALAINRADYYQRLQTLKMMGGGFPEFEQLSQKVYQLLDDRTLDEPNRATEVGQGIRKHLEQVVWIPHTFKAILQGKNHLPSHKFHPRLLQPQHGFLGTGQYRTHFFENKPLLFFLQFYIKECTQYSRQILRLKRSLQQWKTKRYPVIYFGRTVTIATLLSCSLGFTAGLNRSNSWSESIAQSPKPLDKTVLGLVNFLDNPTEFQFACGAHAGQIVDASIEGDRLTIKIKYPDETGLRQTLLIGQLNQQGLFDGRFRTDLPQGSFSRNIQLNFGVDGSAKGVNKDWGGAIAIQKL